MGNRTSFPRGSISAITQTPDGYLWIGTDEGLVRFDGVQFRVTPVRPDPDGSRGVVGLTPDRGGGLWLLLQGMLLVRYRDEKLDLPLSPEGKIAAVFAVARSRGGEMLAAHGQKGVFMYSGNQRLKLIAEAQGIPRSPVLALAQTGDGKYWMGTRGAGLFRLENGTTAQVLNYLPDPKVNCLLADGEKNLWIGTDSGIVLWNGTRLIEQSPELKGYQVLAMVKDRDRNLWVGTDTGDVFRLNTNGLTALENANRQSGFAVTALFEDREGSIWIGSANGLERLRDSPFITYSVPEGVPTAGSTPVFVDGDDRLWFAPATGGLRWWKDALSGAVSGSGMDRDIVYSIAGSPDGLWVGRQRGGLTYLRASGKSSASLTLTVKDGLAQNSVYSVYRDHEGNVWTGTLSGGVSKWDGSQFMTYTNGQGLASNTVTAILQTNPGMWFGTANGLSLLSGNTWRTIGSREGLPSANVNCLLEDKSGYLWAGTNAGLAYWNGSRLQSPAHPPAALREQILGMAQDNFGWFWISTANHVLRVNRDALLRENRPEGSIVEYGFADGLRGVEGVKRHRSVFADEKGRIWFSLNKGISMVDPARLRNSSEPCLPKLQSFTADGAEMGTSGSLRVPAGRRRMIFRFTGLSLSVPDRVRFRYKLDNFDRDWSKPMQDRQAEYTNLGPGNYRFHVMASNPDGIWSATEASTGFFVEPAYWQTWWFESAVLLFAAGIAVAAYRLRLRQLTADLNLRFEERLAERTRIAQELHDTLLQGFLSASMQLHVAAERIPSDSPVKASVFRILDLMKRVTEEGRNAVRGLRASRGTSADLEAALSRIESEAPFDRDVEFRVLSQGECAQLHPVLCDDIYRIGREAILNAFRHAEAGKIEAELHHSSHGLRLTVRDDGRGIEPQTLQSGKDGHWGLSGMRERADRIGARLRFSSTLGKGTEVELTVPSHLAYRNRGKKMAS